MIEICSLFGVRAVSCASVSVLAVVDVVVSVSLEIFLLNYLCEAAVCIHRLTPYLFLHSSTIQIQEMRTCSGIQKASHEFANLL